ncbi:MAG TPA: sugar phosphate isomerase/epimerase family protein [Thermoguttaceae bacterium]|nr:sugar phosphate isomerase/epimerase family protein [Thermoguttaceae bacterium]
MAELSMNETTTFRWSFEEDVARYAAAGIPAIGVWRQKLSDCGQERAIELLRQHQLKVSYLQWAGGFTGSDGRSYRDSVEDAKEALKTAAAIGTRTLIVYSGARAGHTHNHARRLIQSALTALVPLAGELGVTLAVEPVHPGCATGWTFLTSLDEVIEVIEAVGSEQVKMVFDTYHLGQDPAILRHIPEVASQITLVQLGDAKHPPDGEQNRCRLGEGTIPLAQIIAELKSAGYDGYYDVELLGEEIETCEYDSLLEHAKTAFAELVAGA